MYDDPTKLRIKDLLWHLTLGQAWALAAIILGVLGAVASGRFLVGRFVESAKLGQYQAAAIGAEVFPSIHNEHILYTKQESRLLIT